MWALKIGCSMSLEKFRGNPEAFERISERIKDNKAMIRKIEKIIGTSIDSLM